MLFSVSMHNANQPCTANLSLGFDNLAAKLFHSFGILVHRINSYVDCDRFILGIFLSITPPPDCLLAFVIGACETSSIPSDQAPFPSSIQTGHCRTCLHALCCPKVFQNGLLYEPFNLFPLSFLLRSESDKPACDKLLSLCD